MLVFGWRKNGHEIIELGGGGSAVHHFDMYNDAMLRPLITVRSVMCWYLVLR